MQSKIYTLSIIMNKSGQYRIRAIDHALLSKLGYIESEVSHLSPEQLGIKQQQIQELIRWVNKPGSSTMTRKLEIVGQGLQCLTVTAFPVCSCSDALQEGELNLYLVDVSPFVRVENALRKSEEKYRELVENANSIILRWDRQGYITYFNEFAQKIFEYSEEEIIGQHVMDTIVPETESTGRNLSALINDICRHPENYENNINENCTRTGKRLWINWTNKSLYDENNEVVGVLSIGSDITRQREIEDELRHRHKMDAIGQLAGGMAHDFNNMLHGLMGFAEILECKLEDKQLKFYARKIINIARQSADLTNQLLAFARKGQYHMVAVDLNSVILDLVGMLKHMLDKRIVIKTSLDTTQCNTAGDPTQIQNCLLNLSLNAKDAMPDGGVLNISSKSITMDTVQLERQKLSLEPGNYIRIDVCDSGVGISEEVKNHLFEPFYTTKAHGEGTGMGLAAVYGTLINHGGGIVVDTEEGKGSCFSLFFPKCLQQPEAEQESLNLYGDKKHILLVDDEEIIRMYTKILFEENDYLVHTCEDGFQALDYYEQHGDDIDLVILDMMMPEMAGAETFKNLKQMDPEVNVIIASGYGMDTEIQSLLDDGVIDFVQKPFTLEQLSKIMQQIKNSCQ